MCAKSEEHFNTRDMLKLETKNFMIHNACVLHHINGVPCSVHLLVFSFVICVCCDEAQKQTFFAHTHVSVNKQWISKMYNITYKWHSNYTAQIRMRRIEESEKMTDEKEELTTKNVTNLPLNTRFAADTTSCQIGGTHYHAWQTVKSRRKY